MTAFNKVALSVVHDMTCCFLPTGQHQAFQGDIVLTTEQEMELLASSVTKNDPFGPQFAVSARSSSMWPNGVVPYTLHSSLGTGVH